jgi:hypothetical protein
LCNHITNHVSIYSIDLTACTSCFRVYLAAISRHLSSVSCETVQVSTWTSLDYQRRELNQTGQKPRRIEEPPSPSYHRSYQSFVGRYIQDVSSRSCVPHIIRAPSIPTPVARSVLRPFGANIRSLFSCSFGHLRALPTSRLNSDNLSTRKWRRSGGDIHSRNKGGSRLENSCLGDEHITRRVHRPYTSPA